MIGKGTTETAVTRAAYYCDLQAVPVGTTIKVRALRRLVVGRHNKTAVRKGDITTAERLHDDGYAAHYRVQPTVPGMGIAYTVRWNLEAVK